MLEIVQLVLLSLTRRGSFMLLVVYLLRLNAKDLLPIALFTRISDLAVVLWRPDRLSVPD